MPHDCEREEARELPWKCMVPECSVRMRRWESHCPACGSRGRVLFRPPGYIDPGPRPPSRASLATQDDDVAEPGSAVATLRDYVSTGFPTLDTALNGGLARKTLTLVGAPRGGGKTSLILSCMHRMNGPAGYASAEESRDQVVELAQRVGAKRQGLFIVETKDLEVAIAHFDRRRARLVCIDSLNRFRVKGITSDRGSPRMCAAIIERMQDWARERDAIVILISHYTKDGDFAGSAAVQYDVDVALRIARMNTPGVRRVSISKSRIGPDVGRFARFVTDDQGAFREAPLAAKPKPVHDGTHGDDAGRRAVDHRPENKREGSNGPPGRYRKRRRA